MKPYDYAHRKGIRPLTWDDFASLAARLAELIEPFHPGVVLGIARAGLFPAVAVACSLRTELFPIRLTRRENDEVKYDKPVWKVGVPPEVSGKEVAIIDEIADTGQTLAMVADSVMSMGASRVVTACLVSHSWADPMPDIVALKTDEFIIFPWDARVLEKGKWIQHPEVTKGLNAQGNS